MKPDQTTPAMLSSPAKPMTTTKHSPDCTAFSRSLSCTPAISSETNLTQAKRNGDELPPSERAPFLADLEANLSEKHAENVKNTGNEDRHGDSDGNNDHDNYDGHGYPEYVMTNPISTPADPSATPITPTTLRERIETFWQWFLANEAVLYDIRLNADGFIDEAHMDQIIELGEACGKIDDDLSIEIENSGSKGIRGLVISANGIAEVFPVVEAIVDAAPQLDRWRVIRYRQRQETISPLHLRGRTIKPEEVKFGIARNLGAGEFGVYIFMPGYNEQDRQSFHHMGFIFLDLCLGEFDVATKITSVDFHDIHALPKIERVSLKEFPRVFDFIFAKSRH